MNEPPSENSWSKPPAPPPVVASPAPPAMRKRAPVSKGTRFVRVLLGSVAGVLVLIIAICIGALATPPRIITPKRPPVPQQNGFELLKTATEKPVRLEDVGDAIAVAPKKKWTLAEKRRLVKENRSAIAAARSALAVPYLEKNSAVSVDSAFPYYAKFRHMTRVLVLAG